MIANTDTKSILLKCPEMGADHPEGRLSIIVATLDTPDLTGDIIPKGALQGDGKVHFGQWQHSLLKGASPIGRGMIYEDGPNLKADIEFNMPMPAAQEVWQSIKFAQDFCEFSFAFRVLRLSEVRINDRWYLSLDEILPFEVSPAAPAAGIGTGVVEMKAATATATTAVDKPDEVPLPSAEVVRAMVSLPALLAKENALWHP